ncbi:Rrf2 family transcriptional regulator [Candidatus Finniella inopinata]|uniref:Rrf2 family transcriptional regulator n=1 Tax=Candidatus Finniella inopinata TaxID=1696036 RepID=A0A4Q7DJH2_9PROT|nr:Rrf2 family transcriptional regulator [Candidatus Finniella inopinata]RZI47013.1 Rrf2 family transcriptional regulator [Candidatus Finniella inopinata]
MRLSTKARYSVMAMAELARMQMTTQGPVSLATLSERQHLPLAYLEQIFLKLRKKGLVKSIRGNGGGYTLAKAAANIPVFEVIKAVDTPLKATRCPLNSEQGCQPHGVRCLTHNLWDGLGVVVQTFLNKVSLEDVFLGNPILREAQMGFVKSVPVSLTDDTTLMMSPCQ